MKQQIKLDNLSNNVAIQVFESVTYQQSLLEQTYKNLNERFLLKTRNTYMYETSS